MAKIPIADRVWSRFQQYWQEAYDLKEETETTAVSMGYSANAEQTEYTAYKATVENFGTSFAANLNSFAQFSESNNHLEQTVAANITDLQGQIENLTHLVHSMSMANAARQTSVQKLPVMIQATMMQHHPARRQFQQQPFNPPPTFHQPPQMQQNKRSAFQTGVHGGRGQQWHRQQAPMNQGGNGGRGYNRSHNTQMHQLPQRTNNTNYKSNTTKKVQQR